MVKLFIQIPCFNESRTLAQTISDFPDSIPGIDTITVLVIDDGSSDDTVTVARELGAEVFELPTHKGLAHAFARGIRHAVALGADIIVNTDGDNQYRGECIPELIQPILSGKADMVVGCRPIGEIPHFSRIKKFLQTYGSRVVQFFAGADVPDVTSGFRAYSRSAARQLRIYSDFSYTVETLVQAGQSGIRIAQIPVAINPPTRPSRLFVSNWFYIRKQVATLFRIWSLYNPVKLFSRTGFISLGLGGLLLIRFLYYYLAAWPDPSGKVQSVIIAAILILFGFFTILSGVLADLIAVNRRLLEDLILEQDTRIETARNDDE